MKTAIVLLLGATLTGCISSRELSDVRSGIQTAYPDADFHRTKTVLIGPTRIRLVRSLMRFAGDEDVMRFRDYLTDVRRVKVARYQVRGTLDRVARHVDPLSTLKKNGWETAVKFAEDDETLWLLYREQRSSINNVYAVVLGQDELTIVRAQGDVSRLVGRAIADYSFQRSGKLSEPLLDTIE